jgi:hypothetical protein
MTSSTIFITNKSTLVSNEQAQQIAAACAIQITRDFAPLHGLMPIPVIFTANPPRSGRVIDIVDTQDDPNALGWHASEPGGKIYGVVGAKPVLDNRGQVLTGKFSVASVVSHEVLEMFADPACTSWCDLGNGLEVAWEVGDPVQSDSYDIGTGVMMSNFVTLNWFNPLAASRAKFDFMNNLRRPGTMTKGGYWVQRTTTQEQEKMARHSDPRLYGAASIEPLKDEPTKAFAWGEDMPEWLKKVKRAGHGRSSRKLAA